MTWECVLCGRHGFGSVFDFIIGSPHYNRYLGDICRECLSKLLDDNYDIHIELIRKERKVEDWRV